MKESKRNPHYLTTLLWWSKHEYKWTAPIKPSVSNTLHTRSRHKEGTSSWPWSKGSYKKGTQASASQNKQLLKNPKVNTKRTHTETSELS